MNAILPLSQLRRADTSGASFYCGVFSGIAYWLGIPAWIVRFSVLPIALACAAFAGHFVPLTGFDVEAFQMKFEFAPMVLAYILGYIFMPEWKTLPEDFEARTGIEVDPD